MQWLTMIGAGASMAAPTRMPGFAQLREAILCALGWEWVEGAQAYEHRGLVRSRRLPPLTSARLRASGAPPEVVFGTLHRFQIPFAPQMERLLLEWRLPYNAVHLAAATAWSRGWPVWTTNVDMALEQAYATLPAPPPARVVVGRRDADGEPVPVDVQQEVTPSALLKLHGSVDEPGSLAFTDLELLAPYAPEEVQHLAALAEGRRVVMYGYAGADADLHDLLSAVLQRAAEVRWYEPDPAARERIGRAFAPVRFDPVHLPNGGADFGQNVAATAAAFVAAADEAQLLDGAPPRLREQLADTDRNDAPSIRDYFTFDVPSIVHARLVERFGRIETESDALVTARLDDLLRVPPRAVRDHAHWALSRSLYDERGRLHRVVGAAARRPRYVRLMPARLEGFVYDKGTAVLLSGGDYPALHDLAHQALAAPGRDAPLRRGSDLYYLAHTLRYLNRPDEARRRLAEAATLLVGRRRRSDVERYAGVLLEQGLVAIHQGRVDDAFAAAERLVRGPGRYAIGRWSGWGHWLWALAHLYAVAAPGGPTIDAALAAADRETSAAEADFGDSALDRANADIYVLRLLAYRLAVADGRAVAAPPAPETMSRRQSHDVALLRADIALATGDFPAADAALRSVEEAPANDVAAAWARLGRAEQGRRTGTPGPAHEQIAAEAERVGAWWLAAQARLASAAGGQVTAGPARARAVGEPRVLWLVT